MAITRITITDWLTHYRNLPIFDVRSPAEYEHAHISGAMSLPLFTNEQRAEIGTTYKQRSREKAIKIGLDYFGPNMRTMLESAEQSVAKHYQYPVHQPPTPLPAVIVHCWRGGMRSAAVAWLLDLYGFQVYTFVGGYKSFRTWALKQFAAPANFRIIGGFTGSGKTDLLHAWKNMGQAVIDLEGLAVHRGSALGGYPNQPQPTQEMFENKLALAYHDVLLHQPVNVWAEDESQRIGNLRIPTELWVQMRAAPVFVRQVPFEKRLPYLVDGYGKIDKEKLVNAIIRITKRLGPLETKTAIQYVIEDDITACFDILLQYYDKQYRKSLEQRVAGGSTRYDIPESIQSPEAILDYVDGLFVQS